jgi:hypothetical protein
MTVDQLVDKLAKPTYVLRMARPLEKDTNPAMGKSARRRAYNARREIRELVTTYVFELQGTRLALDELTRISEEMPGGYR